MNLASLKFIPQSYKLGNKAVSLEELVTINTTVASKAHIVRDGNNFAFLKSKISFEAKKGYTAALGENNELYFIKVSLTETGAGKANFLKGESTSPKITSPFVGLLFDTAFPDKTEFYVDGVEAGVYQVCLEEPITEKKEAIIIENTVTETVIEIPLVEEILSKTEESFAERIVAFETAEDINYSEILEASAGI